MVPAAASTPAATGGTGRGRGGRRRGGLACSQGKSTFASYKNISLKNLPFPGTTASSPAVGEARATTASVSVSGRAYS